MDKYTCQICKNDFDGSDTMEYRGFYFCCEHFKEGVEKVDYKRQQVMETTNKSIQSQRVSEFRNNRNKYNPNNVAPDGLPIMNVKSSNILDEYERGIL